VVQGITEWLPISSEGINTLILVHFFQKPVAEAILVSIWLHTGTLLAALIYFRRDIAALLRHLPKYLRERGVSGGTEQSALITFLIVSTVLTGVVGTPLMILSLSQISVPAGLMMAIIGVFLIITGVVQKYAPRSSGTKTAVGIKDAFLLGVVQAFSVFPGLSRSGLTVSVLLFRGYDVKYAMRISFLMSIPVVLAAEVGLGLINGISFDLLAVGGILTAFLFGILTIGTLIRIAAKIVFWKFCLFLGGLSLLPLLIERL
jgi:undecaprenyl-diphosphatase